MSRICLVRHGETDWNTKKRLQGREDTKLNENGIEDAKKCANCLSKGKWDVIISSPLIRAVTTAKIIKDELKIEDFIIEADFIERDFGEASGMSYEDRNTKFPDGIIPKSESREKLLFRVMKALNKVAHTFPEKNVIIVSHGGVINAILSHLTDNEYGSKKTILKNGSISLLNYNDGEWNLEIINKTPDEIDCSLCIPKQNGGNDETN